MKIEFVRGCSADPDLRSVTHAIPNSTGAVFDDSYCHLIPGEAKYVTILDSANGKSI